MKRLLLIALTFIGCSHATPSKLDIGHCVQWEMKGNQTITTNKVQTTLEWKW